MRFLRLRLKTKAADAIEVDTTAMSIEEVVQKILDIVHETVFRK